MLLGPTGSQPWEPRTSVPADSGFCGSGETIESSVRTASPCSVHSREPLCKWSQPPAARGTESDSQSITMAVAPSLPLNLSKTQVTDSLSGAHLLYKARRAFVPEEPRKGLRVPEATAGVVGRELRLEHLSLRVTAAHRRAVSHFRVSHGPWAPQL